MKWEDSGCPPIPYRLLMVVICTQFRTEVYPYWCYMDKYGIWKDIFGKDLPEYIQVVYWAEIPEPPRA